MKQSLLTADYDPAHFAGGSGAQFLQQRGPDAPDRLFPLRIQNFDDEGGSVKRRRLTHRSEPVSKELRPGSLEAGNNPCAVIRRSLVQ